MGEEGRRQGGKGWGRKAEGREAGRARMGGGGQGGREGKTSGESREAGRAWVGEEGREGKDGGRRAGKQGGREGKNGKESRETEEGRTGTGEEGREAERAGIGEESGRRGGHGSGRRAGGREGVDGAALLVQRVLHQPRVGLFTLRPSSVVTEPWRRRCFSSHTCCMPGPATWSCGPDCPLSFQANFKSTYASISS